MAHRSRHRPAAFTLVELLVGVAFGAILMGGLMTMATSVLRAGLQDDNQQSAQDAWARVNQFLVIEVGEAGRLYEGTTEVRPIDLDQAPSACSGASRDAGSESFAIRVPNPDPGAVGSARFATITYYMSAGHLMRCGPPVLANGALNFSANSGAAILSYNTTLRQLSLNHLDRSISYTLDFRSPHAGVEFSGQGRAWAQSSRIELTS
jgi:Tfp pilus assembly protein PilW